HSWVPEPLPIAPPQAAPSPRREVRRREIGRRARARDDGPSACRARDSPLPAAAPRILSGTTALGDDDSMPARGGKHSTVRVARFPDLVAQWHPTRNGTLLPADVNAGSHRKVWWRCPNGPDHEWCASVKTRVGP